MACCAMLQSASLVFTLIHFCPTFAGYLLAQRNCFSLSWCFLVNLMYLPTPDIWWWLFICINNVLGYSPLHWYLNGEAWDKVLQEAVDVQFIHSSNLVFLQRHLSPTHFQNLVIHMEFP